MSLAASLKQNTAPTGILMLAFGVFSLAGAVISLGAAFLVDQDLHRAFTLAFFFVGPIAAIILFGVAKIIFLLNDLRSPPAS